MVEHEDIRQPETVSEPLPAYLGMTTPRSRAPKRRPPLRDDQARATRPSIDNRGVSLEEGNDFA